MSLFVVECDLFFIHDLCLVIFALVYLSLFVFGWFSIHIIACPLLLYKDVEVFAVCFCHINVFKGCCAC